MSIQLNVMLFCFIVRSSCPSGIRLWVLVLLLLLPVRKNPSGNHVIPAAFLRCVDINTPRLRPTTNIKNIPVSTNAVLLLGCSVGI